MLILTTYKIKMLKLLNFKYAVFFVTLKLYYNLIVFIILIPNSIFI
jgi:hypothetical protein